MAVLSALDHEDELYDQVNNALNLGITPDEISEALLQVAVYAGVSAWASALSVVREVFEVRGILVVGTDGTVGAVAPMNDEERRSAQLRVTTAFGLHRVGHGPDARPLEALPGPAAVPSRPRMPVEGEIAGIQGDFGLAEVWAREGLDLRTRSLMTLGMLQVLREPDHLHLHVNNALNVGITPEEINEVFAQAGVYGGISSWNNAVMVARDVFIQHGILDGSPPGAV
jgi:4-carboxymuconolactone decarboxylase